MPPWPSFSKYGKLPDMQVCGVFALFLSGAHTLLFWGFLCRPRMRAAFICAYYLAAAACVAAGLRGRSALQVSPLIRYQIRHVLCATVYGPAQQSAGCKPILCFFFLQNRTVAGAAQSLACR